ncbi:MAG: hypothetical protein QXT86_09940 [Archaeoglobaceae archaeon]
MASIVSTILSAVFEIDEMSTEKLPDGRVKVTFLTTGLHEETCRIKTTMWALLSPPMQRVDDVKITELQRGPVYKRYKVEVVLSPLIKRG